MVSVYPTNEQRWNFDVKQMNSAIMVHQKWVHSVLFGQELHFFSVCWYPSEESCNIEVSIARNRVKMVLLFCYDTTDINKLIGNAKEEGNQYCPVHSRKWFRERVNWKNSGLHRCVWKKLLNIVKNAHVIMVECYEHRQRFVVE